MSEIPEGLKHCRCCDLELDADDSHDLCEDCAIDIADQLDGWEPAGD